MKTRFNIRNKLYALLAVTGLAALQGCAVYEPSAEQIVTVPDIVQMTKDGLSSKDIIHEIRKSHTVYSLKADQLLKLREQGVQDSVLNYMEETKVRAARQEQRYADSYPWWMAPDGYFYGSYGWGWPYGSYGWGFGPTIIYDVHRNYRGGYHGDYHAHSGGSYGGGASRGGLRR